MKILLVHVWGMLYVIPVTDSSGCELILWIFVGGFPNTHTNKYTSSEFSGRFEEERMGGGGLLWGYETSWVCVAHQLISGISYWGRKEMEIRWNSLEWIWFIVWINTMDIKVLVILLACDIAFWPGDSRKEEQTRRQRSKFVANRKLAALMIVISKIK